MPPLNDPTASQHPFGDPADSQNLSTIASHADSSAHDSGSAKHAVSSGDPLATTPRSPEQAHGMTVGALEMDRFRKDRLLGSGFSADVWECFDTKNKRLVALKVFRGSSPESAFPDVASGEAENLASLEHPGIVRFYEQVPYELTEGVKSTALVLELIRAPTLKRWMESNQRPTLGIIVNLLMKLTEPMKFAHDRGVIHGDLKPANVFIDVKPDQSISVHVGDFGIAAPQFATDDRTPLFLTHGYASPEQERGEDRLTTASDVYAAGMIFYELLTGKTPFPSKDAESWTLSNETATPPSSDRPGIPEALSDICMKAIDKSTARRYSNMEAFRNALADWLAEPEPALPGNTPEAVIDAGLRSYRGEDSKYFMRLLPGKVGSRGLPQIIIDWKRRLEPKSGEPEIVIGVLHGASGAGKSSFVQAGLIPALSTIQTSAIRIDCLEHDLNDQLRKNIASFLNLSQQEIEARSLTELFHQLRSKQGVGRLVIFIDHFERWIAATEDPASTDLFHAFRQLVTDKRTNAVPVKVLLLVREDFFSYLHNLLQDLLLDQPANLLFAERIEPFTTEHAKKVLKIQGANWKKFRADVDSLPPKQQDFVDIAINLLASESMSVRSSGRVSPVLLVMLMQLVKHVDWVRDTLKPYQRQSDILTKFLEMVVSKVTDNRQDLKLGDFVRILNKFLPADGDEISRPSVPYDELLKSSSLAPKQFDEVLVILDIDLKLITRAIDASNTSSENDSQPRNEYRLSHDFLVSCIRTWLVEREREGWRGRARLDFRERAGRWQTRGGELPGFADWVRFRLCGEQPWSPAQTDMMNHGLSRILRRLAVITCLGLSAVFGVRQYSIRQSLEALADTIATAAPERLPELFRRGEAAGEELDDVLRQISSAGSEEQPRQIRLFLAARDSSYLPGLIVDLQEGNDLRWIEPLRLRLELYPEQCDELLESFRNPVQSKTSRFRVGLLLAGLNPAKLRLSWTEEDLKFLAESLSLAGINEQEDARRLLRPLGERLVPHLNRIFDEAEATGAQQQNVAAALFDYTTSQALTEIVLRSRADETNFVFRQLTQEWSDAALDRLREEISKTPAPNLSQAKRVELGVRRANAAIVLARMGLHSDYLKIFRINDDPEALSQFAARCRRFGVELADLLASLDIVINSRLSGPAIEDRSESFVIYGLLLALGSYPALEIPRESQQKVFDTLAGLYERHTSAAVHSISGWLLRQWGKGAVVDQIDSIEAPYDPKSKREWFRLTLKDPIGQKTFALTFIVFPKGEYKLGSPDFEGAEPERSATDEQQVTVHLTRPFAICDREVTWDMYDEIDRNLKHEIMSKRPLPLGSHAAFGFTWEEAVNVCTTLTGYWKGESSNWQCYDTSNLKQGRMSVQRGGIRMPTSAEWEVAARAGQRTAYTFGSDPKLLGTYAWYRGNSAKAPQDSTVKPPTLSGLYGIQGNVNEWTHDWFVNNRPDNQQDPQQSTDPGIDRREARGGSRSFDAENHRVAYRLAFPPNLRSSDVGLRLALTVDAEY
jgi:serine/threonine protein kinase/formylglycine-generating enzyme required for sulfatase activity